MLHLMTYFNEDYVDIAKEYLLKSLYEIVPTIDIVYTTHKNIGNLSRTGLITRLSSMRDKILHSVVFKQNFNIEKIESLLNNYDIMFQENGNWPYNTGVWLAKCNDIVIELFNEWIRTISIPENIKGDSVKYHDQDIINNLLKNKNSNHKLSELKCSKLPKEFSASHVDNIYLSHITLENKNSKEFGIFKSIPRNAILFHATGAYSIEEKIHVLNWTRNQM